MVWRDFLLVFGVLSLVCFGQESRMIRAGRPGGAVRAAAFSKLSATEVARLPTHGP